MGIEEYLERDRDVTKDKIELLTLHNGYHRLRITINSAMYEYPVHDEDQYALYKLLIDRVYNIAYKNGYEQGKHAQLKGATNDNEH
jgi:hypothetical protein